MILRAARSCSSGGNSPSGITPEAFDKRWVASITQRSSSGVNKVFAKSLLLFFWSFLLFIKLLPSASALLLVVLKGIYLEIEN
jgi:hypothetical protein